MINEKYLILKPEHYCGMFGCIWQVIRGIYHNPNKLYYIDFKDSIYNTTIDGNVWDLFFNQPHIDHFPTSSKIENFVGHISDQASNFIWTETIPYTPEKIQNRRHIFNYIINNYIKLKPKILNKIDNFVEQEFKNKNILGIHLRGTDHPYKKNMNDYFEVIDKYVNDYDKIFISSDSQERFEKAKQYYGDKVIAYDALRSNNDSTPLHMPKYETRWKRNSSYDYQYKICEDVIVEAYLLSNVNFLICCPGSNVNYFSRSINPSLNALEIF
jgi:hypothetical protein